MQDLSPEEREQMIERMRARRFDSSQAGESGFGEGERGRGAPSGGRDGTGREDRAGEPRRSPPTQAGDARQAVQPRAGATTIDALFGPLPPVESVGRVWVLIDKELRAIRVRLGITDGQTTELIEGDLRPGMALVTNITTAAESARPAITGFGFPPFIGGPPGGGRGFGGDGFRGGGGGFGGGGGGGGRGGSGRGN
jgi:hypothetical protein